MARYLPPWEELVAWADEVVQRVRKDLPPEMAEKAAQVPVLYETDVSAELQADGIDAEVLGLFVGEAFEDEGSSSDPLPGEILLFLVNLWVYSDQEKETFLAEVETTYVHELGHYIGFDEGDLDDRGLA